MVGSRRCQRSGTWGNSTWLLVWDCGDGATGSLGQMLSKEKLILFSGGSLQRDSDAHRPGVSQKLSLLLLLLAVKFLTRAPEGTDCYHPEHLMGISYILVKGTGQPWGVRQQGAHPQRGRLEDGPEDSRHPKGFPSHFPQLS